MNRRHFLEASGTIALTPLIGNRESATAKPTNMVEAKENKMEQIEKIAGFTPEELRSQYRHYLFDDFLPFMDKFIIDHEMGGFLCNTDRSGKRLNTNKRAWYDGRGIWVYSFLYNMVKKDPSYLETAKKTVDFVLKIRTNKNEFWPGSYSREGIPLSDTAGDIYGNLFLAEGLAEFSKACGDAKYWNIAKEMLLTCLSIYDREDYVYPVDYGPNATFVHAPRVLGHWMVLLRTSSGLLYHNPDPEVEKIARRCIDAIMNYHYNPEFALLNEALHHDLSRPEGPFSQFVYTGHVMETMWMIMDEAIRTKDRKLFDLACERFKRHVEVAWDNIYGGVFRSLDDVEKNIWKLDKVLWAQEEVLIGTLCMIEHTGDPWALQWFEKMYRYVLDKYPLEKHGYSLWNIGGDRKVTFVKEGVRVENYHHPRHLMLNLLSFDRIIHAGGKVVF
jgi:mannose/cellobiose epimerase-like protein (N-acyl-D-glucosamine 2-epimerase family)